MSVRKSGIGRIDSNHKTRIYGLASDEIALIARLKTPEKVQDFLDTIPINFEPEGDTCISPRRVIRERRAHCIEGALLAATAFMYHGAPPLLFDLRSVRGDDDHVVALFKYGNLWGAVSKSNHAVLRYREPIYKNLRELALSYFHEYIDKAGRKTLREYSAKPFDLRRYKSTDWVISEKNLWDIPTDLDDAKHVKILPPGYARLRKADPIELRLDTIVEWNENAKAPRKE